MRRGALALIAVAALAVATANGCASTPLVSVADAPAGYAWWLRTAFHPRGASLRGIAAARVHAGWCAVDELSPSDFARHAGPSARDDARYAVPGPLVDGRPSIVLLAVFRECAGATGTAMVHLDRASGPRRVLDVEALASPAAYAMLESATPERVDVVFCQNCDDAVGYAWEARAGRFRPVPEDAEAP